jgi:hypothetical protein
VGEDVGVLLSVLHEDLSILEGELFKSEGVLLLGAVGLAKLGDVVDESVLHVGHGGSSGDSSEGSNKESLHLDLF